MNNRIIVWIIGLYGIVSVVFGAFFMRFIQHLDMFLLLSSAVLLTIGLLYRHNWVGRMSLAFSSVLLLLIVFLNPMFIWLIIWIIVGTILLWKQLVHRSFKQVDTVSDQLIYRSGRIQKATFLHMDNMLSQVYQWDDSHVMAWFGDTVIHLGNTVLPEEDNVIVLHKLYGDVRVMVPVDIGISLSYNTIRGDVLFETESYTLKNQQLRIYSENYQQANRRVKILVTNYIGSIEVIRIS